MDLYRIDGGLPSGFIKHGSGKSPINGGSYLGKSSISMVHFQHAMLDYRKVPQMGAINYQSTWVAWVDGDIALLTLPCFFRSVAGLLATFRDTLYHCDTKKKYVHHLSHSNRKGVTRIK